MPLRVIPVNAVIQRLHAIGHQGTG